MSAVNDPPGPAVPPITIVEVGPRDGLQSLAAEIETEHKVAMIERLLDAGVREIEVTSFAHPRMVPRLADAEQVMGRLPRRPGTVLRTLVPNRRGAERALAAGATRLVAFVSASPTYSERNQNMTIQAALDQLGQIAELAAEHGARCAIGVSMAFHSPYEGPIDPVSVLAIVKRCVALDPADLYVADTVGRATPEQVAALCGQIARRWPSLALGVHLHGTDQRGLDAAAAGLAAGARRVETSICGLGGPVVRSPGSDPVGNLATEAVVADLARRGIETGLDPGGLAAAARDIAALLELPVRT
jgi:hydroxymethylglutaryl-CoA lyase